MQKVLVVGSRKWSKPGLIFHRLELLEKDSVVIHGDDNRGVDCIAEYCAKALGLSHQSVPFDWIVPGPEDQGHLKNCNLLDHNPDLVIVFHENPYDSLTTKDCIEEARTRGIEVEFFYQEKPE